jgi:hypothetical protein
MKFLKIIFKLIVLVIALAAFRQWLAAPLDARIYQLLPKNITPNNQPAPETQTGCLAAGGDWSRAGLAPKEACRFPAKDAGKFCLTGFQCQLGQCLGKVDLRKPAIFATGICARYQTTFGCSQEIHFGLTKNAICRD